MSSCIYATKVTDEPKLAVSFHSVQAAQVFYDSTYVPASHGANSSVIGFGLTFPRFHKREGSQLRFNKAVRAADSNGDGNITTAEAKAYARGRSSR